MNRQDKLARLGFNLAQVTALEEFAEKPDVAKVGIADAKTAAETTALANALKARLNELIEALKG